MGLEEWTIPGGRYARQRVPDWESRLPELPRLFDALSAGRRVDRSRPSVEYYRSASELVIYLPLLG